MSLSLHTQGEFSGYIRFLNRFSSDAGSSWKAGDGEEILQRTITASEKKIAKIVKHYPMLQDNTPLCTFIKSPETAGSYTLRVKIDTIKRYEAEKIAKIPAIYALLTSSKGCPGKGPLTIAVENGYNELAHLFIDKGVEKTSEDYKTALGIALARLPDTSDTGYNNPRHKLEVTSSLMNLETLKACIQDEKIDKRTLLFGALKMHDIEGLRLLLNKEITYTLQDQEEAFRMACGESWFYTSESDNSIVRGSLAIAELLLAYNPELARITEKVTPYLASLSADCQMMQLLIENGASVDVSLMKNLNWDYFDWAPKYLIDHFFEKSEASLMHFRGGDQKNSILHMAVLYSDAFLINKIIVKYPSLLEATNGRGETPLLIAAHKNMWDIVEQLVNKGASVDAQNGAGNSALHLAACSGNIPGLEYLLQRAPRVGGVVNLFIKNGNGITPIIAAARNNQWGAVQYFLEKGWQVSVDENDLDENGNLPERLVGSLVNFRNKNGATLLHLAITYKQPDMIDQLLEKDPSLLETIDREGQTPFLMAARYAYGSHVEQLVNWGAKIDVQTSRGASALHFAAERGNKAVLQSLVEIDSKLLEIADRRGRTALLVAAKAGRWDIVECLVNMGARIDVQDNNGDSALHFAARSGNIEGLEYLFRRAPKIYGIVNLRIENKKKLTPIMAAAMNKLWGAVQYILDNGWQVSIDENDLDESGNLPPPRPGLLVNFRNKYGNTLLHLAAIQGDAYMVLVSQLLKKDPSLLDAVNNRGRTPLLVAAKMKNWDIVEQLVESGARIDVRDLNGESILHFVARSKNMTWFEYFLQRSPGLLEAANDNGDTPLLIAAGWRHWDMVEKLVNNGARIDVQDSDGEGILHLAARSGSIAGLEYIFRRAPKIYGVVNVRLENKDKLTPVMLAAMHKRWAAVQYFLDNGWQVSVDENDLDESGNLPKQAPGSLINFRNQHGNTLLHLAAIHGNANMVHQLLEKDPSLLDATNKRGRTALLVAAKRNHWDIVNYLINRQKSPLFMIFDHKGGHSILEYVFEKDCHKVSDLLSYATAVLESLPALPKEFFEPNADGNFILNSALHTSLWEAQSDRMKAFLCACLKGFSMAQAQIQAHGNHGFVEYLRANPKAAVSNEASPLFLPALLFDPRLLREIGKLVGKEVMEKSVLEFKATYPQATIDELVYNARVNLNKEHLLQVLPSPKKIEGRQVKDILDIFDSLDFQGEETVRADARKDLLQFIEKFENHKLSGIKKGSDNEKMLEAALTATIDYFLSASQTTELQDKKKEMLVQFLREAKLCGPKIVVTATQAYHRYALAKKLTFDEQCYYLLGEKRSVILQSLVGSGSQNVHDYTTLVKKIGKQLGIPGAADLSAFDDTYGHRLSENQIQKIEERFWRYYSAYHVMEEIVSEVSTSLTMKDTLSEFYEQFCPKALQSPYVAWKEAILNATSGSLKDLQDELSKEAYKNLPDEIINIDMMLRRWVKEALKSRHPTDASRILRTLQAMQEQKKSVEDIQSYLKSEGIEVEIVHAVKAVLAVSLEATLKTVQMQDLVQQGLYGQVVDIMNPPTVIRREAIEGALKEAFILNVE